MFIVFRLEFSEPIRKRRKINKIELKEDTYHECIEHSVLKSMNLLPLKAGTICVEMILRPHCTFAHKKNKK